MPERRGEMELSLQPMVERPSFRLALLLPDENNEKMIAVKSRGDHGPALLELFDVHTGTLKTKVMGFAVEDGKPARAAPWKE